MRILVVAMINSIHTVRWVGQFENDQDKDIFLFPSTFGGPKEEFRKWPRIYSCISFINIFKRGLLVYLPFRKLNSFFQLVLQQTCGPEWRVKWLIKTIKHLKPDIVHSLEFQNAGYVCLEAKKKMGDDFPVWIATNWGSDIYLYSQLKTHVKPISEVLQLADFYSAECERDYHLARQIGLNAESLPVIPNAGGLHLEKLQELRSKIPPKNRKTILVKGYQTIFGRALTVIQALEKIATEIQGTDICVVLATPEVEIAAELLANKTGLSVRIISLKDPLPHADMIALYAKARIYVGLSISDGISTSMLEAMALGAFPIQTCTSCANEWIENGVSGFISPCDEPDVIGQMILKAVKDDDLVESASALNWETINQKAEYGKVRDVAREFYMRAYASRKA